MTTSQRRTAAKKATASEAEQAPEDLPENDAPEQDDESAQEPRETGPLDELAQRKAAAPGLYSLGNPMDRVFGPGEPAPARPKVDDPDGSDPGFVGVRPGDTVHIAPDGTTVPYDPTKAS